MKDTELVAALRQMKVNTKSVACIGCHYENRCSTEGCSLIGIAADRLNEVGVILSIIKGMYAEAKDSEKTLLRTVLALFERYYGHTKGIPRNIAWDLDVDAFVNSLKVVQPKPPMMIYDFEICSKKVDMVAALDCINRNQWQLITVTYGPNGYTLFFRRPVRE